MGQVVVILKHFAMNERIEKRCLMSSYNVIQHHTMSIALDDPYEM